MKKLFLFCLAFIFSQPSIADEKFFVLASTTSTQNSGLYDIILPMFIRKTGIEVRVVAVGTGQALRIARNGDADALLVHHRPSEDAFVEEGFGIERRNVMYNDFIIVGPSDDPAGIASSISTSVALQRIAESGQSFASRGDDSGTHKKERELWKKAGVEPSGQWYLETGSGMGTTLNLSVAKNSYTITDRGTWITFGNKGELRRLFSGDPMLFNPYGIILVNPARHPHAKVNLARTFSKWIVSDEGQKAISEFRISGHQAFCPNASGIREDIKDRGSCPAEVD